MDDKHLLVVPLCVRVTTAFGWRVVVRLCARMTCEHINYRLIVVMTTTRMCVCEQTNYAFTTMDDKHLLVVPLCVRVTTAFGWRVVVRLCARMACEHINYRLIVVMSRFIKSISTLFFTDEVTPAGFSSSLAADTSIRFCSFTLGVGAGT